MHQTQPTLFTLRTYHRWYVRRIPIGRGRDFFEDLLTATRQTWPQLEALLLSYPHNPTTEMATPEFFKKVVDFAKEHNIYVIHDFAYADLAFDGECPSFMQAKGAKCGRRIFPCQRAIPWWFVGFALVTQIL